MATTAPFPTPAASPIPGTAPARAVSADAPGSYLPFLGLLILLVMEFLGLVYFYPVLKTIRAGTILAYGVFLFAISRNGLGVLWDRPISKMLSGFVCFTGATMLWAVVRTYVPENFRAQLDYLCLFVSIQFLVDRPSRFTQWSMVMSGITLFLVARNFEKLLSSERTGYFAAGYFLGDGNDFSWGMATLLPFSVYLVLARHNILVRLYGLAGAAAAGLGIIGTQSRGATLAAGAMVLFYWTFIAKRKALAVIALVVVVGGSMAIAPAAYFERMNSIGDYEEDTSAQGRLHAWGAAIQMATHYPLGVGAGSFNSAYGRYYMPANPTGFAAYRWISAHSVYFKVLGEYGILGVILIISIIGATVRLTVRLLREIRSSPATYRTPDYWPGMIGLSIVGYAVGAVFLGGLAYPYLFMLAGLTLACQRLNERDRAAAASAVTVPDGPTPPPAATPAPRRPARSMAPRPTGSGSFF